MKILVTGRSGQLALSLKNCSKTLLYDWCFKSKADFNISDEKAVYQLLKVYKPDVCINTAAYTAVDKCEETYEEAKKINALGVGYLAKYCKIFDIQLIHISTDYVFDGKSLKPYSEKALPKPINKYGESKYLGEKLALEYYPERTLIIRTSWLYSLHGHNFLKTMLKLVSKNKVLKIVSDQIGTPTFAKDLANFICTIILQLDKNKSKIRKSGIYHFSNEGFCSWYDFAKAIFEAKNLDIKIIPILTKDYPTPAKRAKYSVLSKEKIKKDFNLQIRTWQEALQECLSEKNNLNSVLKI